MLWRYESNVLGGHGLRKARTLHVSLEPHKLTHTHIVDFRVVDGVWFGLIRSEHVSVQMRAMPQVTSAEHTGVLRRMQTVHALSRVARGHSRLANGIDSVLL